MSDGGCGGRSRRRTEEIEDEDEEMMGDEEGEVDQQHIKASPPWKHPIPADLQSLFSPLTAAAAAEMLFSLLKKPETFIKHLIA